MKRLDKATLDAFVDGALSPEEAARVVMHLADHPEDQAYVDRLMALNEMLGQAYDAPMSEPVPAPIRAAILGDAEGAEVIPFRRPSRVGNRPVRRWAVVSTVMAGAVAASFAAFAVFGPATGVSDPLRAGALLASGPVSGALSELSSGETRQLENGAEVRLVASFQGDDGAFCRVFALRRADGGDDALACNEPGAGWRVRAAVEMPPAPEGGADGFSTAAGSADDPLDAALDEIGAGFALSATDEAAARAAGWR